MNLSEDATIEVSRMQREVFGHKPHITPQAGFANAMAELRHHRRAALDMQAAFATRWCWVNADLDDALRMEWELARYWLADARAWRDDMRSA